MFKNTTDWISVGNRKRESEEEMYIPFLKIPVLNMMDNLSFENLIPWERV